ncbi:MAG TPA: protein kinase [Gemmatimonadaceae bacterium]|nr:protein kinase [Gemmatimonadaceae bacterium]
MSPAGTRPAWRSLSLPWKLFLAGSAALLLVLALVFVLLARWAERSGEAIVRRELEQSVDLVAQYLSARQRSLAGGARVFVQDPNFRSFVHEHLRDEVRDQASEANEQLEASWVFVVDDSGTVLANSDPRGASGNNMGGVPLIADALQGRVKTGFGVSGDSLLFQAVAVPIVVPGQAPIGALVATKVVDSALARDVKAATSAEIVFYVRDEAGPRLVTTSFDPSLRAALSADVAADTRSRTVVNGVRYATHGAAVTTAGGDIVGGYVVMSARDATSAEIAEVRRILLIAALGGVALLGLASLAVDRRVARPLRGLAQLARRAESGDDDSGASVGLEGSRDEVATLSAAVQSLAGDVRDRSTLSAAVASALSASPPLQASIGAAVASAPVLSMRRVQGSAARVSTPGPPPPAAPALAPAGEPGAGDTIAGRYRIDGVLGSGELGVTYRVRDRVTGAVVALERFRPARLGDEWTHILDSLRDEIRGPRHVVHRNVVRVRDVGEEAGVVFVTMDLVEGLSLATLLRGGPLGEGAVIAIARQLCRALDGAESRGAVHGSLSPQQILIGYDGLLRVTDFTLARMERRLRARVGTSADASSRTSDVPNLAGATVGAPEYMSPEQLIGEEPGAQTDLYAAGVVLYECVTGATPFRTDSPLAFLAQKLGDAELATGADLHEARPTRSATARLLNEVIVRLIAPDAARRARSAAEILQRLEHAG